MKIGKYIGNLLDTWARNYLEVFNKLDISQVSAAEYKQILHLPFESVILKKDKLNSPASRTWALRIPLKI